jgi:hypothetical protein
MLPRVSFPFPAWLRLAVSCVLLAALAGCGGSGPTRHAAVPRSPSRYYPPPGPAGDPWGPYIHEASGRFNLPEQWIRGVMHQESGGQEDVISWAGAIGLMQLMPDTYALMRDRYGLGNDPFDPHNNILAGTAYLREMYDKYGSPGFLAAYNAGPGRVDRYLAQGTPLPAETVNYVAAISPHLGPEQPSSGPGNFGGRGVEVASGGFREAPQQAMHAPAPGSCDPDAAYDPDRPCKPLVRMASAEQPPGPGWHPTTSAIYEPRVAAVPLPAPAPVRPRVQYASAPAGACLPGAPFDPSHPCWPRVPERQVAQRGTVPCNPDAAYDPRHRCVYGTAPVAVAEAAPRRPFQEAMRGPIPVPHEPGVTAATPAGHWAIQVGAYPTLPGAQSAAEHARQALPELLRLANVELPPTAPLGSQVAFMARLTGLTPHAAADACSKLAGRGMQCMTISPART